MLLTLTEADATLRLVVMATMRNEGGNTMSAAENEAIVNRIWKEVINEGKLNTADELFDTSYVHHEPEGCEVKGTEGFKKLIAMRRTAFPDFHVTVEELITQGDKVVSRWTATGTHKGNLMGIGPTDRQGTMTGITVTHIVGGKVVEDWENRDRLGMLRQLGAIPPLEKGFFAALWWLIMLTWRNCSAQRLRNKPLPLQ